MIQELTRERPTYTTQELLLHEDDVERSYLPEEFAPHTITGKELGPNMVEFDFEYSIDEKRASPQLVTKDVEITLGKYSQKVLSLMITCSSIIDLAIKLQSVVSYLEAKERTLLKDSYKKNYQLVRTVLERSIHDFTEHPEKYLKS